MHVAGFSFSRLHTVLAEAAPPIIGHVISPIFSALVFLELRKGSVLGLHVRSLEFPISFTRNLSSMLALLNNAAHSAVRLPMLINISLGYHLNLHSCDSHSAAAASAH